MGDYRDSLAVLVPASTPTPSALAVASNFISKIFKNSKFPITCSSLMDGPFVLFALFRQGMLRN